MKIPGLVLVVMGLAAWMFDAFLLQHAGAAGLLQYSMFLPLSQLALIAGVVLLILHYVYHAVVRLFHHCE